MEIARKKAEKWDYSTSARPLTLFPLWRTKRLGGRGCIVDRARWRVRLTIIADPTFLKNGTDVRVAILHLEHRAVPSVLLELVLALGDGQLQALDGRRHHVRVPEAQLQLLLIQSGEVFANGGGGSRLAPLLLHHRVEEVLLLLLAPLLFRFHAADVYHRVAEAGQIRSEQQSRFAGQPPLLFREHVHTGMTATRERNV